MQKPTVVILAGGLGTRIQHLLPGLPKPLVPVAGQPFLEWVIRFYARQGLDDFIISAGYRGEAIAAFCAEGKITGVRMRCKAEERPLGTAGGFCHAVEGEEAAAWLVCNGDSLVLTDLGTFLSRPWQEGERARLLGLEVSDAGRFGTLVVGPHGRLKAFREKAANGSSGCINGGVYLFPRDAPPRWPTQRPLSFEHDVFPRLLAQGEGIGVDKVTAPFLDIGTEDSLREAEAFIQNHLEHFA